MTRSFRPYDPDQLLLLPVDLREWLPEGHLAYFLSDLVETALDLSAIWKAYEGESRAYPAYHPAMMTKVLLYAYCTGVFSSRRMEKRLHEDVAFRVLAAQQTPDHKTISEFRRRHLKALQGLFQQVLLLCKKAGLVRLGHVALDGTKIQANASKHSAMSYGRMVEEERRLADEVAALLAEAERVDAEEDARYGDQRGDELPKELQFRQQRLAKIREAKAALEAEAREKAAAERKGTDSGGGDGGGGGTGQSATPTEASVEEVQPDPKAQRNFTDPDSRIMRNADKAFVQAYNAQAAVDADSQVIVATEVTNQAADSPHLASMVLQIQQRLDRLPDELSADAGYGSEANLSWLQEQGIEAYVATGKFKHREDPQAPPPKEPKTPLRAAMAKKLRDPDARSRYDLRKETVEPVFGQIKEALGFRRFLLRGIEKVKAEWSLVCTAHNLRKLWVAAMANG
ncbi:MAG TPA: IS1182 family transposase [Acidobacteriaceae bacterium]|nr:IS1182 family transposase [Acidobacteriaceae bacterium]